MTRIGIIGKGFVGSAVELDFQHKQAVMQKLDVMIKILQKVHTH